MNKNAWIGIGVAVVAVVAIIVIAIIASTRPKGEETITIGVSLPLSGDAAVWGKSQKDGYELALSEINSNGGVNGKKLVLVYGDDKGLPKDGLSLLQKLLDVDGITILTGVANSSVALAYIPIIDKRKILFVSSGASSPKLTGSSEYFFRTWPSDNAEALAMAKYAFEELKLKNIGILFINNEYGVGLSEPFSTAFQDSGGTIVSSESFEQGATDFRAQLAKLNSLKLDAVYLAGNPREMGRAIKQARELGMNNTQFLSISTLNDPEVFDITGAEPIEGTIITDASFDPNSDTPEAKRFMTAFRTMLDKEPGILANTAYDALMIIADAIRRVGADPTDIAKYLRTMKEYKGVAGAINFTEGGDVNRPIRISIARGSHFEVLRNDFR